MTQNASKLNFAIDPNQYEIWGSAGGGYITESGKYLLAIVNAVYEPTTSNANNWKLSLTLRILAGKLKDKEIGTSLNVAHSTDTTREAALKQLASYCTAIGHAQAWDDAAVLYNKPFQAYIEAIQEPTRDDPNKKFWKNDVKNWFYPNGEPIQQGVFAAGALLSVVYNGDAAPTVPNGAPSTIAPPAPANGNPAAGAGGYGNGAPQNLQQQQNTQQYADPNAHAAGGYGGQQQQHVQQQQHTTTPPAFAGGGAPSGAPNGGSPAFAGGGAPQTGGFGAPPSFQR